jgi:acyl transferase domain-containing protein
MIAMAIEAARQLSAHQEHQITGYRLKNMRFLRAININTSEHGTEAQIHLRPRRLASNITAHTWYDWRIYSLNSDEWTECAYGSIKVELGNDNSAIVDARNTRVVESLQQIYQQAASQCSQSVHHDQLYDNLAKFGFSYGPYFRQLRGVRYSKTGCASATLALRGYAEKMLYAAEDPCVIHPTTLDSLCHLQMVALSSGGWKQIPTMIFSHLRELWVSQKLLTAVGNPLLSASTHETMRGFREAEFDTIVLLADTQEPVLTIEGERGTAITSLSLFAEASAKGSDGIIYSLDFRPDLSLLNTEETRNVLTPCFKEFEPPVKENIDRADAIALYHVERVLKQLSRDTRPQDKSHLKRYISWMERVANERTKYTLESRDRGNLDIRDVLREAHSEPSQRLIAAVGDNLYQIITGQTDPLQVIFEGGLADGT